MSLLKGAVFSRDGLGDGLIALILAHNLQLNGWNVTFFHTGIFQELSPWLEQLQIQKEFAEKDIDEILKKYDRIFIFYSDTDPFTHKIIKRGKSIHETKITVLNPCFSKNVGNQPFYEDALFSPFISIVENLFNFCKDVLQLPKTTKHNGLVPSKDLVYKKKKKRICFHVTSSRPGKNWPIEKYISVARSLKKMGFEPAFLLTEAEKKHFSFLEKEFICPSFPHLIDLASFLYESGYFIGNDSGVGHLASCLGIPTLSLLRGKKNARLWKPAWTLGKALYPSPLIPNISGMRIRDKHWKKFISVKGVLKSFYQLKKKVETT